MLVLQQMVIFVLLMLVGAWARKKQILTEENQSQITQLVLNIAYPAIILSGVTGEGPHIAGLELLQAGGVILGMLAVLFFYSGNVLPLLAALYNKEVYPVSVQGVALTTAAAVVTMPLVALDVGLG
ncbi:MAG: AEC family transporter [Acidaminococcus sp.]|uniref:AEC family transporter n=1 Tax=Acidaminococcus sp. TaxID=1872103 RepID=UPI003F186FB7